MKTVSSWSFRHYVPADEPARAAAPYICRIAPAERGFSFDFIDNGAENAEYRLFWRLRGDFATHAAALDGFSGSVDGLAPETDYEFWVERKNGAKSSVRLVRTGYVPGIVVNYLHPDDPEYAFSGRYIASPSILRMPDGRLLASMDVFAGGTPQNLTLIYESDDDGKTWRHLTDLFPCFWGKLFLDGGRLYMLGCSNEYGDLLIGRSDDGGANWTMPVVLFRGAACTRENGWHRAPMRIHTAGGRIMTDVQYGSWARQNFCDLVVSAPAGSDLLDASNWVCTEPWDPRRRMELPEGIRGGIEGNVISTPDGGIVDFLRFGWGNALVLRYDINNPEAEMTFEGVIDFPSNPSKWQLEYDAASGKYITLISWKSDEPKTNRNLLALACSDDLRDWKLCQYLIDYRHMDPKEVGFQYVDYIIDGDDILYLSRTAFNNAHNYHDSNYITFHKIENFRTLLK